MNKKFIYILIALCFIALGVQAENTWETVDRPNEIRVGWGDQLFETLMWHNPTTIATTMPATWQNIYHENFMYSQHVWVEYQRRLKPWFSVGGMIDGSGVQWDNVTRDGTGAEVGRDKNQHFYNLVIMPTVRFTYFHHPYVNLYSGLGFGIDINGGTGTNVKGRHTDAGAAIQLTLIGMSANYQRYFFSVDIGGLYALKNANTIFMASSKIFSVAIGARF